jgi:outer membrane protein TolC
MRIHCDARRRGLGALLAAALAAAAPLYGQVALITVVDLARRNSTPVRIAQADVAKATAILAENKNAVFPSLLFSTGLPAFPETGFTGTPPSIWSATVQSQVFSIPQKRYLDAARFGLEAAGASLKDAREQVALDVSSEYIELDTVNQDLQAAHQQEEYAARLVAIEQERTEAGVDPFSALLEAQLQAAQVKLRRQQLEARASTLAEQLAVLTGLPAETITTEHSSIPEVPQIKADAPQRYAGGVDAAQILARSKQLVAKGDEEANYMPQLSFIAQYNRNTTLLNDVNSFFKQSLPANNFSSGIQIEVPLFDMVHRAKSHETAADALRATVEAEQARKQNDIQIVLLTGSLRELDTLAEIASLKQQIAKEQLRSVLAQLELGNGQGSSPGAPPQLSPKAEQLSRIDERQKYQDSLDAGLDLAKARLNLLRALGHMQDWLNELHGK